MSIADLHARTLDETRRYVAGIKDDQWDDDTPCPGWNVRDVLNHLVGGNLWVAPLVSGKTIDEVGDRYDGDVLGLDPLAAYDASATSAAEAFRAPGALQAPCAVSYGPIPGETYAGHRFVDVLVHGWDLAKATGQDTRLDPALVQACLDVVEPEADIWREAGVFGPKPDLAAGADVQARLLALVGRTA